MRTKGLYGLVLIGAALALIAAVAPWARVTVQSVHAPGATQEISVRFLSSTIFLKGCPQVIQVEESMSVAKPLNLWLSFGRASGIIQVGFLLTFVGILFVQRRLGMLEVVSLLILLSIVIIVLLVIAEPAVSCSYFEYPAPNRIVLKGMRVVWPTAVASIASSLAGGISVFGGLRSRNT